MKKITLLALVAVFGTKAMAQGEANDKTFRFGLNVAPSLNWYSPDDKKKFESEGTVLKFAWGLTTDFRITENIWFSTGLGMSSDGGKINFSENPTKRVGYMFGNNEIFDYELKKDQGSFSPDTASRDYDFVLLSGREYRVNYITIPLLLKMKTNEIGYMTYFGQFGVNTHIRSKARAFDTGVAYNDAFSPVAATNQPDLTELDITKEIQPIRMNLVVGLGIEYNLAGTTSVFGALNFNYGITNAVKKESTHLIMASPQELNNGKFRQYSPQKFIPFSMGLTVGVLF
ncbi:MAG: outer membrane beta-barrel protein [Flavobacteriales bacterium]